MPNLPVNDQTGKGRNCRYELIWVDVSVSSWVGAGTIKHKSGEVAAADVGVMRRNSVVASRSVRAKPGGVSRGR